MDDKKWERFIKEMNMKNFQAIWWSLDYDQKDLKKKRNRKSDTTSNN